MTIFYSISFIRNNLRRQETLTSTPAMKSSEIVPFSQGIAVNSSFEGGLLR
jgi:hypothetical protein